MSYELPLYNGDNVVTADETLTRGQPTDEPTSPLLVTVQEACRLLSCGKTHLFVMINKGLLERRKVGNATRITMRSIRELAGL